MENMEPLINLSSASEDTPVKNLYNSLGYIVPELSLTNGQSEALIKTKEWFKQISNPSKRSQTSPLFYIAGFAGTGKSTIVPILLTELNIAATKVAFLTYTGKASRVS